jgi:hypothetical protein
MLGEALSLCACTRGGRGGSWGSGSTSMSSKLVSVSFGEHGSTGSCAASNGARFFLIEIVGARIGACHCKPLLDLTAPLLAERIVKMNDGLFVRNSFALDPSCKKPREP